MLQHTKTVVNKQKFLGFLLIIFGIIIILIKASFGQFVEGPSLFYIGGSGEVVGQFPIRDELIDYSVTFDNPTKRSFKIYTVEPILTEKAKSLLLDKIMPLEEMKKLKSGGKVEYSGQFHVNTNNLTEGEILEMIPLIKGYRVIFNQYEEVIMSVHNITPNDRTNGTLRNNL